MLVLAAVVSSAALSSAALSSENQRVSDFAGSGLDGWQERRFADATEYRIVTSAGHRVLEARADGSASGLYRRLTVDLAATPVLSWCWWIASPVEVDDVAEQSGDDFAARVYVVFSGGLRFWNTTSLVYVWGVADAPAKPWRNPFADQAAMLAVRRDDGGRWQHEQRDVAADYRQAFGREPPAIVAVAIMTDTDQTGGHAHARYAALSFAAAYDGGPDCPCPAELNAPDCAIDPVPTFTTEEPP